MASREAVAASVAQLAEPLCVAAGLTLVDVELVHERGRTVLRVTLDKSGGVRLDDLEDLHRRLGRALDDADPLTGSYDLELTSPGLDRVLKKDREFEIFRGREVEVRTYGPVDGRRSFVGVLDGLDGDDVVVLGPEGARWCLPRGQVAKAKLHPRL